MRGKAIAGAAGAPNMRGLLLSSVAAVAAATGAFAADLPSHAAPAHFVPPPAFTFAGVYVGATLGFAGGFHDFTQYQDPFAGLGLDGFGAFGGSLVPTGQQQTSGVAGGPEIGVNFQSGSFVYGLEADINFLGNSKNGSHGYACPASFCGETTFTISDAFTNRVNYLGTARGRLGLAVDRTLIYFTAGLAYGKTSNARGFVATESFPIENGSFVESLGSSFNGSATKIGWVVGAGVEYALTPNWTIKGEALYANLGDNTVNAQGSFACTSCGAFFPVDASTARFSNALVLIRAGVNYKFDWLSAPQSAVVARY